MSSSFISNPQNRRLSLNLYRSLLRKCNHFDSNPKYKAFFVTPPSLRYQLPTFFLPSVSFTQNLKVLFRLYAKYEYPTQNELNHCLSDGYFVLRNLNLASTYHKKQSDKEQSILQDVEMKKPNSLASESNLSPEINDIIASLQESVTKKAINIDINDIDDQSLKTTATNNINNSINDNNNNVKIDKDKQKESNNNNSIVTPIPLVNLNSNNSNNNNNNVVEPNFWVIESKDSIKPGTLLVSHPSLDMAYRKSVVLITHQVNEHHYGYIINQPLPTSSVIGVLQDQFDNAPQLKNHQYSKNLVQHFRFSAKRPLSPFTKTPWYCGGPSSIEHTSHIVKGLEGLPMTQIIHPFSDLLPGSIQVRDGLYIGGSNFKEVGDKIKTKEIPHESVMMMVGCSLWKPGELRKLIDQGAWFQADCTNEQIFKLGKDEKFWAEALQSMGGDYRDLINN